MNLPQKIEQLSDAVILARTSLLSSEALTLPEKVEALTAAAASLKDPGLYTKLQAENARLNALVSELQSKVTRAESAQTADIEARVTAEVKRRMPSVDERASQIAVQIAASMGVPEPADGDLDRSALARADAAGGLKGIAAVEAHYSATLNFKK